MSRFALLISVISIAGCAQQRNVDLASGDPIDRFESACTRSAIFNGGSITDCLDAGDRLRARRAMRRSQSLEESRSARNTAAAIAKASPEKPSDIYATSALSGKAVVINLRGLIQAGDFDRLGQVIRGLPINFPNAKSSVFNLDSPGGSLIEAEKIAGGVHGTEVPVMIPPSGECSSSCFLIFASAKVKYVSRTARVGVHSASEGPSHVDSFGAKAFTTAFARDCLRYGVPEGIIGKLVTTPPGSIYWLSPSELNSMGVKRFPESIDH